MAMTSDNKVILEVDIWSREFGCAENEINECLQRFKNLVDEDGNSMIEIKGNMLSVPSCEPRLNLIRGGRKGGENSKPTIKPDDKPLVKPDLKQRERERETKIENKSIEDLMKFFGFNINVHFDKTRKCNDFFKCLLVNNQLAFFGSQFKSYVEYKTASEEKVHSFSGFLGNHENKFEDGGWNAENWTKKLTDFKKLNKAEASSEVYVRPKSKNHL
jgi:hypothetical protein